MLSKTPDELGDYRKKNPDGYNFLVSYMVYQSKQMEKAQKKAKARRGK